MDSRLKSFWQPNSISVEIWRRLEREREKFLGYCEWRNKRKGERKISERLMEGDIYVWWPENKHGSINSVLSVAPGALWTGSIALSTRHQMNSRVYVIIRYRQGLNGSLKVVVIDINGTLSTETPLLQIPNHSNDRWKFQREAWINVSLPIQQNEEII